MVLRRINCSVAPVWSHIHLYVIFEKKTSFYLFSVDNCSQIMGRAQSNTWPVMWTDSQTDYPRLRNWFSLLWWSFTCRTRVFDLDMVIIIWWVDLPTWLHLLGKASILCSSWLLKSSWDLSSVTASLSLVKIDASHELVMWCHSLAESMI